MVEICIPEAMLETLTEVPGMSGKLSSLAMLPGVLLERPLLRMECKEAAFHIVPSALVFLQGQHGSQVGFGESFQLLA